MDMNPAAAGQFAAGQRWLNMGKPEKAIPCFSLAREENETTTAEIEQQLGICYRLAGRYEESGEAFENALRLATTTLHMAQILRDHGMLFLQEGSHEKALGNFQRSCVLLHGLCKEVLDDEKASVTIEYFVSNGFIGRAHLLMGHRAKAHGDFLTADIGLRSLESQAPYELNNLVWLMKTTRFFARLKLARRAWRLARRDRNMKRQVQIALLALSPRLG